MHDHADEAPEFVRRGTGGTVPLCKYGRPGTFGLAVAEKLAASGLTEAEYVAIAKRYKAAENRFSSYIRYFKKEGFNIVLENGRYVERKMSATSSASPPRAESESNKKLTEKRSYTCSPTLSPNTSEPALQRPGLGCSLTRKRGDIDDRTTSNQFVSDIYEDDDIKI